jgi:hypothetical protein
MSLFSDHKEVVRIQVKVCLRVIFATELQVDCCSRLAGRGYVDISQATVFISQYSSTYFCTVTLSRLCIFWISIFLFRYISLFQLHVIWARV